jgi:hypothetical protein
MTALLAGVFALGVLAGARPAGPERQPGEVLLTEEEQAEVLRTADDGERPRLETMFQAADAYLPVAYTRAYYRVVVAADGSAAATELGSSVPRPGSHLRLPDLRMAAVAGSAARYDLYASVGIARLGGPGYRWVIATYFRWSGSDGIDSCNRNEDSIATAWAGGLTLQSDNATGYYQPYGHIISPLDIYRSEVSPNAGVGWSFHELKQRSSQVCTSANWGEGDAYVSEPSWQSKTSNVTMKYVHTRGSTSYRLGFSVPVSFGPSITVSPPDNNQWSTAAFATFNH